MDDKPTERWGMKEIVCKGRTDGNPFTDHTIQGHFSGEHETVTADGFYDGDGIYKVRFMPSFCGKYSYTVSGTFSDEEISGEFTVCEPACSNHGPVMVKDKYHFAFADGTAFYPLGTTCYVWHLQSDELIEETLRSLKGSRFNKIRFCILPKHYDYNLHEPRSYPFEGTPMDSSVLTSENFNEYTGKTEGNDFDLTRPDPAHYRHIEKCILALQELGIEADLIVMHPYDRWGFSSMPSEANDLYWKYVIARFSAYRNVWWSLANEFDLVTTKTEEDWEHYAQLLTEHDPYSHLRSIHNCVPLYDYSKPWITHCSIQRQGLGDTEYTPQWRMTYGKPVVLDEIAYEGDLQHGWGNITGEELLRRFWTTAVGGGYPGHGETLLNPSNTLWWSHGGRLYGESWKRIGFLLDILEAVPGLGLRWIYDEWDASCAVPEDGQTAEETGYRLYYYGIKRPAFRVFHIDDETPIKAEVIDTWNMTITDAGVHTGKFTIELGSRQYMAVRLRKYDDSVE